MNQFKNNKMNWQKPHLSAPVLMPSEQGKLPPQNVDLEEVVLGALLLEKEAVEEVISILHEECFYKTQNALVFNAILSLYKKHQAIDILTVVKELKEQSNLEIAGGAYYVSQLTNRVASSANIKQHALIILQSFLKRDLIRMSTKNIQNAYDDTTDVFDIYGEAAMELDKSLMGVMVSDVKKIDTLHMDLLNHNMAVARSGKPSGLLTHFPTFDKFMNGWQPGLYILAGRPGMGKTAVAVAFAIRPAIIENKPVAIFSLEMSSPQLTARIQSTLSGVNSGRITNGQLGEEEVRAIDLKSQHLYKAPIYIDDTPSLSLIELRAKARRLKQKQKIKLIVIDYLQLMTCEVGYQGNREQEISTISRGLKALSKELEIPIIALSQLSRQVESRPGSSYKPKLSDLRESGAIEQDADVVMFCYRPTYYGIEDYEYEKERFLAEACQELLEIIIAKNRHGSLGSVMLGFIAELTKVTDWDWSVGRAKNVSMEYYMPEEEKKSNLENKNKNDTFVQSETKLSENTGFLSERSVESNDNGDVPF